MDSGKKDDLGFVLWLGLLKTLGLLCPVIIIIRRYLLCNVILKLELSNRLCVQGTKRDIRLRP